MGLYRGEFAPGNPTFPAGSAAVCREATGPVDISASDITYTDDDERALETFNRNFGELPTLRTYRYI
jgi:alcohol oxidase